VLNVIHHYHDKPNDPNKSLVILHALPLFTLLTSGFIWAKFSPTNALQNYPHLLISGTGFYFAFLVVCHTNDTHTTCANQY
jgi:hypothetical protein